MPDTLMNKKVTMNMRTIMSTTAMMSMTKVTRLSTEIMMTMSKGLKATLPRKKSTLRNVLLETSRSQVDRRGKMSQQLK